MDKRYKPTVGLRFEAENGFPFGWLLIGILAFAAFLSAANGQSVSAPRPASVERIESVGFTVSDADKAIDFYTKILSFEKISDKEFWDEDFARLSGVFGARVRVVRLKLGGETLELTEYLNSNGRPIPVDSRSNDRWFQHIAIIVSDMDKAFEILRKNKVRFASNAPQLLPKTIPNAAGIRAFYFKDFDNHVLEILQFPADKGAKKWHDPKNAGKIFLGIDHTAIVVGDTDASRRFYKDSLGMDIVGESINFGAEQEHLNNVFGARLRITGLRTKADGIAVEFLEYLTPRDGRKFPEDTRSSDLWHWQTSFEAERADDLAAVLLQNKFDFISAGIVAPGSNNFEYKKAFMVRDADGHAARVFER